MFKNAVKNKSKKLGGVAFIFYALALLFGDLSGGEGLAGIDFATLVGPLASALVGFGIITEKDAG